MKGIGRCSETKSCSTSKVKNLLYKSKPSQPLIIIKGVGKWKDSRNYKIYQRLVEKTMQDDFESIS